MRIGQIQVRCLDLDLFQISDEDIVLAFFTNLNHQNVVPLNK
jgi:hypothetical protein